MQKPADPALKGGNFLFANRNSACTYREGSLPGQCAPLAIGYVPMQTGAEKVYAKDEALAKGTLFPGLDLPFKNYINSAKNLNTPLMELMALDFAVLDLGLYLDTHKDDAEAFALYKEYVRLLKEGKEKYIKLYGPIRQTDAAEFDSFNWLDDPWPWNAGERKVVC
ncbi:MAG: spore coat protein CotJB [Oscillospiraceae bacterium]|nr:spore coat protein CotJB [Oscillospiraceae bacterium]